MRIAIVAPHFVTDMGYQETGWYSALVSLGHRVRVFASCYVSYTLEKYYPEPFPEGLSEYRGGEVLRLPARKLPRNMVRCDGLLEHVVAFRPELTLAVYPGSMFAGELFIRRDELPGVLVSTFGDNRAQRRGTGRLKRAALDAAYFLFKRRYYRTFIERSDIVLMQTPDTIDFILGRTAWGRRRERLQARCWLSALGFDPEVFFPDAGARQAERRRLGVAPDEVVGLYSCKITPIKRLDIWVSVMAAAVRQVPRLRPMLIGVRPGDPECERILSLIGQSGCKDRFLCLPFATREELPRLYNAADFGVWYMQPSVTIQEAMGTGVYMILTDSPTASHLVIDPETGRYFRDGDYDALRRLVTETAAAFVEGKPLSSWEARTRRAAVNRERFGYVALAERLVAAARDLPNAAAFLRWEGPARPPSATLGAPTA
ncbi:MAG: glycosyltransferase, partial [Phycisphaerae bacterium]